jgi:hypothetical protein
LKIESAKKLKSFPGPGYRLVIGDEAEQLDGSKNAGFG